MIEVAGDAGVDVVVPQRQPWRESARTQGKGSDVDIRRSNSDRHLMLHPALAERCLV